MNQMLTAIVMAGVTAAATGQVTIPSYMTAGSVYPVTSFAGAAAGTYGVGGMAFDATGANLWFVNIATSNIYEVPVVRNAGGTITGFGTPLYKTTSSSAMWTESGLTFSSNGTLFVTHWDGTLQSDLYQYSTATGSSSLLNLAAAGIIGTGGGCEFLPATATRGERLLYTDYSVGGVWEIPLTVLPNQTYSIGKATLFMPTPPGFEGFQLIPTGPFGMGRGLIMSLYDSKAILFVALDPFTGNPHLDAKGNPMFVNLMNGLDSPMDVLFDPVTKDIFISSYSNLTATVSQFSGTIQGGFEGQFELYAPGCPQQSGQVATVDTVSAPMRAGLPITIRLSQAEVGVPASIMMGFGGNGNSGGLPIPLTACKLHINPLISVPVSTSATGDTSITFPIPGSALGLVTFTQGWCLSPASNMLGIVTSDAAVCIVGM